MDTSNALICSGRRCSVKKPKQSSSRQGVETDRGRRSFSWEFKREAVRLMKERREQGVNLSQIGRELGVRPDQLRAWTRHVDATNGRSSVASTAPGSVSP